MHVISKALILGNIDEAQNPMPGIAGLLLVAEEFRVEPPVWLDYEYIPFKEFSAVDPARLDRAVTWLEARGFRRFAMSDSVRLAVRQSGKALCAARRWRGVVHSAAIL